MTSFQLAGSIVLLLFGVKLVLGQVAEEVSAIPSNATLAQRAVYPLAIPTIAGAGSMLTVVLLTDNNVRTIGEQAITTSRLAISLAIVFCVLALSKWIFSVVGRPGIEVHQLRIRVDPGKHRRAQHDHRCQIELRVSLTSRQYRVAREPVLTFAAHMSCVRSQTSLRISVSHCAESVKHHRYTPFMPPSG